MALARRRRMGLHLLLGLTWSLALDESPSKEGVHICRDTPGWSNGWSGCAWLPGGKDPALCRPTINASWPSTSGWTCEYYRQQGLCGKLNGVVREIRQSARGRLHNWPEKNCCGCESQDDTSCNRQTGKSCALEFGFCGASRGPAYCHNLSTCLCLPGHCASTEGYCSLQVPVQEFATPSASPASTTCRDTPDWANGWSACAYEEGGRNSAWCKPTPGAVWPSTMGWTCAYYREKGLCKNGNISTWAMGRMHNYPERNCCGCHAVQNTTCNRNTGGLCSFGFCDPSRGPTVCVDGKCLCQEGHCGTTAGVCSLTVEAIEASLLTPEGVHEAAGQATKAGISAAEAARTAGKSAADDVNAAATAAGRAAIRAGLSREQAAEAAADAAGQAASEAKATPQQAGSAAADWVRKQEKSAGMPQDKQAHAAAKSAARAAAKAAKLIFLTEQQAAYAAQAAALEAGLDSGLSLQQAESLAVSAVAPGQKNEPAKGAAKARFGPDMVQDASNQSSSNSGQQLFGWAAGLLIPVAGACLYCYLRRKGARGHRRFNDEPQFSSDDAEE